jgi:hypothetical protein
MGESGGAIRWHQPDRTQIYRVPELLAQDRPHRLHAAGQRRGVHLLVCPASFGYRAAFNDAGALGLTAAEYEPEGKAAREIEQVYEFMSKLVKETTRKLEEDHGQKTRRSAQRDAGRPKRHSA